MAIAGSLTYDTKIDKKGFEKGLNFLTNSVKNGGAKIKDIISALGITKLIGKAIGTINNSIDGAVSRIDTLNNFPKVMSNIGITSEDSEKAVKKLSDGLKGIPTTLDDASLAVQRFTSVNGNVDKSTEYFLALNNALLAGGASADIQSSAMEQLSQAYSKGKPDMIEWRSLQTAMPAQLKQVAQAFNMTTDELGEALRNGKISMDDFMDKIVELNKNGTGEFQSFEEQAKNSTGGIATSVANMKTAITRGVSEIIKSIDNGLQEAGFGTLSEIINNIGKTTEKVLDKITTLMKKTIKVLKETYDWIGKNRDIIKKLIIVVASLTAGYVAYQKVLTIIKAINMVKNFSNLINPVGLVTAGIVALTTAFVGLQVAHFNEITSLNGLKKEVENQKKAWEDLQATRQNTLNSSMTEIEICEDLKNELMQISDENGKVKTGYEDRAKVILNTLNEALGTEYQLNGNIIEQYQDLKNNIDEVIAKKKAEAVLTAYQEEYGVAVREQSKATETLIGLKQQLKDAQEKLISGNFKERLEAQNTINQLSGQIKTQTDLIGSYGKTVQDYENLQKASIEGSKEAITLAIDEIGISYDMLKENAGKSTIEQINAQQKYVDAIKSSLQEAKEQHNEYQQKILQSQLTTNEEQLNNLKSSLKNQTNTVKELSSEQVEAWKETANRSVVEYSQLLAQVPEETQKEIEKATGIVGQDVGFYRATGETATNATTMFRENLQLDSMANNEIQKASTEINNDTSVNLASSKLAKDANDGFNNNVNGLKWGSDLGSNIANGLKSKKSIGEVTASAAAVAGCISDYLHHTVPEKGPLKNDDEWMLDMMENFAKGMDKGLPKVIEKSKKVAKDIKNSFDIQKINDEIYRKMQNAVARENASITAKATLEANKSQPLVIARDHTTTINNTQQFYSKESTPYEEQKQAKQQLRRLAYGL